MNPAVYQCMTPRLREESKEDYKEEGKEDNKKESREEGNEDYREENRKESGEEKKSALRLIFFDLFELGNIQLHFGQSLLDRSFDSGGSHGCT